MWLAHRPPAKFVQSNTVVKELSPQQWALSEYSYIKPQIIIIEEECY